MLIRHENAHATPVRAAADRDDAHRRVPRPALGADRRQGRRNRADRRRPRHKASSATAGAVALLALWFALAMIPIALGAGLIAYAAMRFQRWRGQGPFGR
jgi:hypothetical protein